MNLTLRRNLISRMGIEAFTMLAFMPVGVYAGSGSLVKGSMRQLIESVTFLWEPNGSGQLPMTYRYIRIIFLCLRLILI